MPSTEFTDSVNVRKSLAVGTALGSNSGSEPTLSVHGVCANVGSAVGALFTAKPLEIQVSSSVKVGLVRSSSCPPTCEMSVVTNVGSELCQVVMDTGYG